MTGAPPGAMERCTFNEWTDSERFSDWQNLFNANVKPSVAENDKIILDVQRSHKILAAIDFAREYGIVLLTLPPHSTHNMQSSDVSFFKSLNVAYNRAAYNWMLSNACKRISPYEVADIFADAYNQNYHHCGKISKSIPCYPLMALQR